MKKRKQKIIDKEFQLKTTFSIIGIVYIVASVIIILVGAGTFVNNQRLSDIADKQDYISSIQNDMSETLLFLARKNYWTNLKILPEKISKDIEKNRILMNKNIITIKGIISNSNILIISILCFSLLQGVLLFFVLIRRTHRISGPLYVISRYIDDITEGNYPDMRPLRKSDEFKDFYEKFSRMADTLKEKDMIK